MKKKLNKFMKKYPKYHDLRLKTSSLAHKTTILTLFIFKTLQTQILYTLFMKFKLYDY